MKKTQNNKKKIQVNSLLYGYNTRVNSTEGSMSIFTELFWMGKLC